MESTVDATAGVLTLTVDCGGTGLKAAVLGPDGAMRGERVRVRTPYPCPPDRLLATLADLVAPLAPYDRISIGLPGILRGGRVLTTPHYVTEAGPFTPRHPELVAAWAGYDVASAAAAVLGAPVRAVNDAELHALAVISGHGFEVVMTFGTGVGFTMWEDGRALPKIELSAHPLRKGETYDERLGDAARRTVGNARWNRRVGRAIAVLRPVVWWDRLYVGGGNARHLTVDLGEDVTLVPNSAGLVGGVRLWDGLAPEAAVGAPAGRKEGDEAMELEQWAAALAAELGLDAPVDVRALLDVARVAAHSVDRPAAPITTYLVGWAAAARGGTPEALAEAMAAATRLAESWPDRQGPPEDDSP
jgi:polyphosphate glucokinase